MSPPLTLGADRVGHRASRGTLPFVFNIQDVFPDVAVELGVLTGPAGDRGGDVARASHATARADAVTVLSEDMRDNVAAKVAPGRRPSKVRVIPNFVDTDVDPAPADGERLPARVRARQARRS